MKTEAALTSLALAFAGAGHKDIPVLPDGFQATIEAVIDNRNYAVTLKETYDMANDRVRVDRMGSDGRHIEICDVKHKQHLLVTQNRSGITCESQPITTCRVLRGGGHLTRASAMLEQIGNLTYTFMGADKTRGISTEYWKSSMTSMNSPRHPEVAINYTLAWYFTAPTWIGGGGRPGAGGAPGLSAPIPILALLEGTHKNTTSGRVDTFVHHYNFIEFAPIDDKSPMGHSDDLFKIDPKWKCPGTPPPPTPLECGDGTVKQDNKCVCSGGGGGGDTTESPDVSGGRGLLEGVQNMAKQALTVLPGLAAGFVYGAAH